MKLFTVGFGNANRANKICDIAKTDHTTAVILASVHFEWMIKRAILKLGTSPTKQLREDLENVYSLRDKGKRKGYLTIWNTEVGKRLKNANLGTVMGSIYNLEDHALKMRGRIVHGNGTVSPKDGELAVDEFLGAPSVPM